MTIKTLTEVPSKSDQLPIKGQDVSNEPDLDLIGLLLGLGCWPWPGGLLGMTSTLLQTMPNMNLEHQTSGPDDLDCPPGKLER